MNDNKLQDQQDINSNGLYDYKGLIDMLIVDINESIKQLINGNYVGWCSFMVSIIQRLRMLKNTIDSDMNSKDQLIKDMGNHLNKDMERVI